MHQILMTKRTREQRMIPPLLPIRHGQGEILHQPLQEIAVVRRLGVGPGSEDDGVEADDGADGHAGGVVGCYGVFVGAGGEGAAEEDVC